MDRPTLLLTRPADAARRFLAELRAAGGVELPAVISPLMETRFFDIKLPDCTTIVFTSETAVAAVARLGDHRSAMAWCVGPRTAAAARNAGYRIVEGGGNAECLAMRLAAENLKGKVFCPLARDRAFDMQSALENAGIDTVSAVVYAQESCPPTAQALDLMASASPVILPLFSARSAQLATVAFRGHRAPLRIAAMSRGIAEVAAGLVPQRTIIASSPDGAGLIRAILPLAEARESG